MFTTTKTNDMSKIAKEITKTQEAAINLLKSKGAYDFDMVTGRCGCGQTPAVIAYGMKINEMYPRVAICENCGEDS